MKKYLIAASMLALVAATGANAADIIQHQPAPVYTAPVFSWTGFYVGGQIGWAWADTNVDSKWPISSSEWSRKSFSPDPNGFMGGIYLGYNYDFGNNFVAGIETDFAWSDTNESSKANTYNNFDVVNGTVHGKVKQKWEGATRIRVGYAADRWMPYLAGGVAYSKIDSSVRFKDLDRSTYRSYSGSDTFVGWTIGAGVDYAVTDNVLLRLEYRYTDFGDNDYSFRDGMKFQTDYKTNDVRVGVAYKF